LLINGEQRNIENKMSKFYVVATPIGNMGDITLRAIETLKEVDLILCEDTRDTKKILNKYNINTPTMSYHSQSKLNKTDKIFALLEEGKNLALVSDAGTPTISDPGAMLIAKIKEKYDLTPNPSPYQGEGGVWNPKFVLMGDHVTALPEESLENSKVDYVLAGGDYDFLLLKLLNSLSDPDSKDISRVIRDENQHSLDELPLIDR
jgi:hypothetical protein